MSVMAPEILGTRITLASGISEVTTGYEIEKN